METFKTPALSVDIETLGTSADAVVLQIGACFFDAAAPANFDIFEVFESNIRWMDKPLDRIVGCAKQSVSLHLDVKAQQQRDRTITKGTLEFWFERQDMFVELLKISIGNDPQRVLEEFFAWVCDGCDFLGIAPYNLQVWMKGPAFDQAILEHLARSYGLQLPWMFFNVRDLRTTMRLLGYADDQPWVLNRAEAPKYNADMLHDAEFDAVNQAVQVQECLTELRERLIASGEVDQTVPSR